jgi:hypothetical protein
MENTTLIRNLTARLGRKPTKTEASKVAKLTKSSKNVNGYVQGLIQQNEERAFKKALKEEQHLLARRPIKMGSLVQPPTPPSTPASVKRNTLTNAVAAANAAVAAANAAATNAASANAASANAASANAASANGKPVSSAFTVQKGPSQNRLVSKANKTMKKKKLTTAEKETRKQEKEVKKLERDAKKLEREAKKLEREAKKPSTAEKAAKQQEKEVKELERQAKKVEREAKKVERNAKTKKVKMPSAATCALCATMIANGEVV